jgi:hypothetical protein
VPRLPLAPLPWFSHQSTLVWAAHEISFCPSPALEICCAYRCSSCCHPPLAQFLRGDCSIVRNFDSGGRGPEAGEAPEAGAVSVVVSRTNGRGRFSAVLAVTSS